MKIQETRLMHVGNHTGPRLASRVVVCAAVAASFAFAGCGGADQTTGSMVEPDPSLAKQQDAMREFYKKNPLNKTKKQR
jgi:hypothetical protein